MIIQNDLMHMELWASYMLAMTYYVMDVFRLLENYVGDSGNTITPIFKLIKK